METLKKARKDLFESTIKVLKTAEQAADEMLNQMLHPTGSKEEMINIHFKAVHNIRLAISHANTLKGLYEMTEEEWELMDIYYNSNKDYELY